MRPGTEKIIAPERQAELMDRIGSVVGGKYTLERLLGIGGMGGVYAATPLAGGSQVAIKILSVADPAAYARIAARFAREARAITALDCPHIVKVLEAGSDDTRPYLVMELLEGLDLGQRLRRDGRIAIPEALHIAAQMLVALGSAHEAGIVHRDLKPDNVFLMKSGGDECFCKLLDFGMSKFETRIDQTLALALTKKGMAVGTPFYMAPEQARAADDVDGRVDLWALGAILFECLAGRPPFVGPTQEQVLISICTTDAPDVRTLRADVPPRVAKLITRALTRDREARFQSPWQMLASLVDVAPAEARMLPAKAFDVARVPSTPDRSGPISPLMSTIAIGPSAEVAEATGAHRSMRPPTSSPIPSMRPRPRPTKKPQPPSAMRYVIFGLCALVLGVGVTIYVLAMTNAR